MLFPWPALEVNRLFNYQTRPGLECVDLRSICREKKLPGGFFIGINARGLLEKEGPFADS